MTDSSPNITKNVPHSANLSSISEKLPSVTSSVPPTDNRSTDMFKMIIIVAVIIFLGYNVYLYFSEGTDILGKYFGIGLFKVASAGKDIVGGAQQGVDAIQETVSSGTKSNFWQ